MKKYFAIAGLALVASGAMTRLAAQDGKALYDEHCKKCHGVTGTPAPVMVKKYPKLAKLDEAFFAKRTDDSVVTILKKGKNENMKAFADKMKPEEMAAVAKYMRTLAK
jgi:mono/diheme cytochrome c family protein